MEFESVIHLLGDFGLYQKWIYFLMCLPFTGTAFFMLNAVFLLASPKHRCAIPGYPDDTYAIQSDHHQQQINLTIPPSSDENYEYAQCNMYKVVNGVRQDNSSILSCSSWVYDKSVFLSTFTTEQNFVCDDELKPSHAQMIFFAGVLTGSLLLGNLSDILGRKKTLCTSMMGVFAAGLGVAWAPDFLTFCVLRFIIGCCCAGAFLSCYVIGIELVGKSKRMLAGMLIQFFSTTGSLILTGMAYGIRDWKYLQIACAVPIVLFLSYWVLVPESARWLVSQGRTEMANKIMRKAAKVNKVTLPELLLDRESVKEAPKERIWHVFRSRVMTVRTLIIYYNWMVSGMVYYGLAMNTGNLGGNFYLNFMIGGLVEIPAMTMCVLLLNRIGRKKIHATCMIIGGVTCVCTLFTMLSDDTRLHPLTITLAMIGKSGISAAFAVIYIWSAELFPTVVRNAGMGTSSSCARVGSMIAPYIADISKVVSGNLGRALPLVIFGGVSVLAGVLCLYLPETRIHELPETIEDGENYGEKSKSKNHYELTVVQDNKAFDSSDTEKNGKIVYISKM